MSVSAETLQILVEGGKGTDDMISVARAGERGDDYRAIVKLIDELRGLNATPTVIAIAVCGLAENIVAANQREVRRIFRDHHTERKDSNRSRRGMPDSEWRALRGEIFQRDGHKCQYCFCVTDDLTCDHIIPLVRGGTNDPDNLTTACRSCNSSKGDKLLSEWTPL